MRLFELTMKLHQFCQWPAMTRKEKKAMEKILCFWSRSEPLEIFEYGSGYSTVYWARFLQRQGFIFHLHSIDNHAVWHKLVVRMIKQKGLQEKVTLYLSEFKPFWEKAGWDWSRDPACGEFAPASEAETDYIQKPLSLKRSFDLVIVDARFRRRCLEVARQCLKSKGIVFLHDAQKSKYLEPTKLFKYSRFFDSGHYFPLERTRYQFWVGSEDNAWVTSLSVKARY